MLTFYAVEWTPRGRQRRTAVLNRPFINGILDLHEALLEASTDYYWRSGKTEIVFLIDEWVRAPYHRQSVAYVKVKLNPLTRQIEIKALNSGPEWRHIKEEYGLVCRGKHRFQLHRQVVHIERYDAVKSPPPLTPAHPYYGYRGNLPYYSNQPTETGQTLPYPPSIRVHYAGPRIATRHIGEQIKTERKLKQRY